MGCPEPSSGFRGRGAAAVIAGLRLSRCSISANTASLRQHVKPAVAEAIAQGIDETALADWLKNPGNDIVTLADADYPQSLLNIPDPPPLLYLKGRRALLNTPALAVVGSRNATAQGLSNAEAFAQALSVAGLCIVS